jgi:hypothetical protein
MFLFVKPFYEKYKSAAREKPYDLKYDINFAIFKPNAKKMRLKGQF